jgi:hypothetical protein
MFQTKIVVKSKNTSYIQLLFFFRKSCYLWDVENNVQRDRPKVTIWRMRFACGYLRPETHTHTHNMQPLLLFCGNSTYFIWWIRYELYIGPRMMCPSLARTCDFLILQAATQRIQQTRSSQNFLNIVLCGARYSVSWQDNETSYVKKWVRSSEDWRTKPSTGHDS